MRTLLERMFDKLIVRPCSLFSNLASCNLAATAKRNQPSSAMTGSVKAQSLKVSNFLNPVKFLTAIWSFTTLHGCTCRKFML